LVRALSPRGSQFTDALCSFRSLYKRTPPQPLLRLALYSAAVVYYLRTKFVHKLATSVTSIIYSSSVLPVLNLKMADVEAELAAAGKELDKVSRLHKPTRAPC
jgi:hypothetical protein